VLELATAADPRRSSPSSASSSGFAGVSTGAGAGAEILGKLQEGVRLL